MCDRMRGVEQVGQPDVPIPVPIDDARPVAEIRKGAPEVLDRAERWIDEGRLDDRATQLITDLTAALRAEMRGWANARGDAVDYSLRADELEAIVRDLAAEEEPVADIAPEYGDYVCMVCPEDDDDSPGVVHVREDHLHAARCAWLRSREFVSAHPVSGDQP